MVWEELERIGVHWAPPHWPFPRQHGARRIPFFFPPRLITLADGSAVKGVQLEPKRLRQLPLPPFLKTPKRQSKLCHYYTGTCKKHPHPQKTAPPRLPAPPVRKKRARMSIPSKQSAVGLKAHRSGGTKSASHSARSSPEAPPPLPVRITRSRRSHMHHLL